MIYGNCPYRRAFAHSSSHIYKRFSAPDFNQWVDSETGKSTKEAKEFAKKMYNEMESLKAAAGDMLPSAENLNMAPYTVTSEGKDSKGVLAILEREMGKDVLFRGNKTQDTAMRYLCYAHAFHQADLLGEDINVLQPGDRMEVKAGVLIVYRQNGTQFEMDLYPWNAPVGGGGSGVRRAPDVMGAFSARTELDTSIGFLTESRHEYLGRELLDLKREFDFGKLELAPGSFDPAGDPVEVPIVFRVWPKTPGGDPVDVPLTSVDIGTPDFSEMEDVADDPDLMRSYAYLEALKVLALTEGAWDEAMENGGRAQLERQKHDWGAEPLPTASPITSGDTPLTVPISSISVDDSVDDTPPTDAEKLVEFLEQTNFPNPNTLALYMEGACEAAAAGEAITPFPFTFSGADFALLFTEEAGRLTLELRGRPDHPSYEVFVAYLDALADAITPRTFGYLVDGMETRWAKEPDSHNVELIFPIKLDDAGPRRPAQTVRTELDELAKAVRTRFKVELNDYKAVKDAYVRPGTFEFDEDGNGTVKLTLQLRPAKGIDLGAIIFTAADYAEIERVDTDGMSPAEIEELKKQLIILSVLKEMRDKGSLADMLGTLGAEGDVEGWIAAIAAYNQELLGNLDTAPNAGTELDKLKSFLNLEGLDDRSPEAVLQELDEAFEDAAAATFGHLEPSFGHLTSRSRDALNGSLSSGSTFEFSTYHDVYLQDGDGTSTDSLIPSDERRVFQFDITLDADTNAQLQQVADQDPNVSLDVAQQAYVLRKLEEAIATEGGPEAIMEAHKARVDAALYERLLTVDGPDMEPGFFDLHDASDLAAAKREQADEWRRAREEFAKSRKLKVESLGLNLLGAGFYSDPDAEISYDGPHIPIGAATTVNHSKNRLGGYNINRFVEDTSYDLHVELDPAAVADIQKAYLYLSAMDPSVKEEDLRKYYLHKMLMMEAARIEEQLLEATDLEEEDLDTPESRRDRRVPEEALNPFQESEPPRDWQRRADRFDQKAAEAELYRIREQMGQYARRGAWKGVESEYGQALYLFDAGKLDSEAFPALHHEAARSAQTAGQLGLAYVRLKRCLEAGSYEAMAEVDQWVASIENEYAYVRIEEGQHVVVTDPPFDPQKRRAIGRMRSQLEEQGVFEGFIPVKDGSEPVNYVIEEDAVTLQSMQEAGLDKVQVLRREGLSVEESERLGE